MNLYHNQNLCSYKKQFISSFRTKKGEINLRMTSLFQYSVKRKKCAHLVSMLMFKNCKKEANRCWKWQ